MHMVKMERVPPQSLNKNYSTLNKKIKDQHALNELLGVYNSLLDELDE